jgi:hypothetical protein
MLSKLLIQYSDKNLYDYADKGLVNMDAAIKEFNDFDWDKEYKKINKRDAQKLTSTTPGIILQNDEKHEELSIYGRDSGDFDVYYKLDDRIAEDVVYADMTRNQEGLEITDFIIAFFQNELDTKFIFNSFPKKEQYDAHPIEDIIEIGKYNPIKHLIHFWVLILFAALFIFLPSANPNDSGAYIFWLLPLIILILYIPFFAIYIQYLSKPKLLSASLEPKTGKLTLRYTDKIVQIEKTDIIQCVYTYCTNYRRVPWYKMGNIVLTLKNKSQYYLTTLTFKGEELKLLAKKLNVHYFQFDTSLPFINRKMYSDKVEVKPGNKTPKEELEMLYSRYSDEMLAKILENKEDYQPDAVNMAKKELERRNKYAKNE